MVRNTVEPDPVVLSGDDVEVDFDVSTWDVSVQIVDHKTFVEKMYDFTVHNLTMGPANVMTKLTSPDMRFAGFVVMVGNVAEDEVVLFHCGDEYLKANSLAAEIEAAFIRARQERNARNDQAIAAWQEAEAAERYGIN